MNTSHTLTQSNRSISAPQTHVLRTLRSRQHHATRSPPNHLTFTLPSCHVTHTTMPPADGGYKPPNSSRAPLADSSAADPAADLRSRQRIVRSAPATIAERVDDCSSANGCAITPPASLPRLVACITRVHHQQHLARERNSTGLQIRQLGSASRDGEWFRAFAHGLARWKGLVYLPTSPDEVAMVATSPCSSSAHPARHSNKDLQRQRGT